MKSVIIYLDNEELEDHFTQWLYLSNMSNFGFHDYLMANHPEVVSSNFQFSKSDGRSRVTHNVGFKS